jgi:hopanoid biosynthesis associated RND transporter like protein HpnN
MCDSQRALEAWIALVVRRPRFVLIAACVAAVAAILLATARLGFKTDRIDLVGHSSVQYQNWQRVRDEFGGDSDLVVVIEGSDRARIISALETLARDLAGFPQHFHKICYRARTDRLRAKGLFQLPIDDLERIRSRIEMLRPLLSGGWSFLTLENVLSATFFRLQSLAAVRPLEASGEQGLRSTVALLESLALFLEDGRLYQSPWGSLRTEQYGSGLRSDSEYFFSANGRLAFLRVAPLLDSKSFSRANKSVAIMRAQLARLRQAFPDLEFGLTGLPVLEADEMEAATYTSRNSALISIVGVTLLFVTAFRALRHPAYVVLTLILSACWSIGWVALTVGHLTVLSVSFIVTLIGLGVDFGILWLSRYEAARCVGLPPIDANLEAARCIGRGTIVGAATTALAFFATMFTGFLGLREMGWIAGCGVLFCLIGTLTALPAMLVLSGKSRIRGLDRNCDERPAFGGLARHPWAVLAGVGAAAAAVATQSPRLRFDYNLLNLQAHGIPSVEWEKRLIEETGTSAWYALSIRDSPDDVRAYRLRFEALESVGRVVEIATLIPTDQDAKRSIIEPIHAALANLPERRQVANRLQSTPNSIVARLTELANVRARAPAAMKDLVARLAAAANDAHKALERLDPLERARRLGGFERMWSDDLLTQLHTLRDSSNPEPVTVADLPPSLVERFYGRSGKWLVQVFAKSNVWDLEPLQKFCDAVSSVDPNVTGKPISALYALRQMHDGYCRSAWLASVVVVAAVWLDFKRFSHAILACIPLLLGCGVMFGAMGMLGIPINPANLVILPLIFGIGVDAGVHVMHDFRCSARPYVLPWRLSRALLLCGATTVIGFASLMVSRHNGMFSIGLVLSIGIAACSCSAMTVLPALLHLLWPGRLIVDRARQIEPGPPPARAA